MKTENEIRLGELREELKNAESPFARGIFKSLLDENKLAVKNEREEVFKIIEEWYQEHSINYLGKRDCVCEIDRDSVNKLKSKLEGK